MIPFEFFELVENYLKYFIKSIKTVFLLNTFLFVYRIGKRAQFEICVNFVSTMKREHG